MPKRSRSHQLEGISIQRFEGLLPPHWVCRRKGDDYGIDLEIEIFDQSGDATGLLFYAQLKATDSVEKERSVSMKVDRLEYLSSFDSPSMIVRYCDGSNAFHWSWLTNIFARTPKPESKSVTVKFDSKDVWTDQSPEAIIDTLKVYRTIRQSSRSTPIGLTVNNAKADSTAKFELNHAVSRIRDSSRMVSNDFHPEKCLPVSVWVESEHLIAAIDVISSVRVHLNEVHRDEIFEQLAYVLAYMASRDEFVEQARNLTQIIVEKGLTCYSPEIACALACQMLSHPCVSTDIAILNKLHEQQDLFYAQYIHSLLACDAPMNERSSAVDKFYTEAISAHDNQPEVSQAVLHYSYGNFFRNSGSYFKALVQYNLARKKNTKYLEKEYYLAELAAVLYFSEKFRLSAKFYASSYQISGKHKVALCAGDAFLYSGKFKKASEYFEYAVSSENEFESADAALKISLVNWFVDFSSYNKSMNQPGLLASVSHWSNVMNQCICTEEYADAFGACIMVCFILESDVEAWAQAITLSTRIGDIQTMIDTLTCAVWLCGYEPYTLFREQLKDTNLSHDMLESIDEEVALIYERRVAAGDSEVTFRVFEQENFDLLIEAPSSTAKTGDD